MVDTLCTKATRALDRNPQLKYLILAGGVACNSLLRQRVTELMERRGGQAIIPGPHLCTDNAAMIAYAGWLLGKEGYYHQLTMETVPLGRPCLTILGLPGKGFRQTWPSEIVSPLRSS